MISWGIFHVNLRPYNFSKDQTSLWTAYKRPSIHFLDHGTNHRVGSGVRRVKITSHCNTSWNCIRVITLSGSKNACPDNGQTPPAESILNFTTSDKTSYLLFRIILCHRLTLKVNLWHRIINKALSCYPTAEGAVGNYLSNCAPSLPRSVTSSSTKRKSSPKPFGVSQSSEEREGKLGRFFMQGDEINSCVTHCCGNFFSELWFRSRYLVYWP